MFRCLVRRRREENERVGLTEAVEGAFHGSRGQPTAFLSGVFAQYLPPLLDSWPLRQSVVHCHMSPFMEAAPVTARTLQGMARVRSGQAPAWPLSSDRSVRRGSRVKREFACTFTRHFSPVLVVLRSQSRLRLEGRDTDTQRAIPGAEPSHGSCTFRLHADRPPEAGNAVRQQACPQPMRGAHLLPRQASREYPDAREQVNWRSIVRRTGEIARIRYEEVSTL